MRLWTISPHYLDCKGLVALWREALLAQKVLRRQTKGYRSHPQLDRFKVHPRPVSAIGYYLMLVAAEGKRRGYCFDEGKIFTRPRKIKRITVTEAWISSEVATLRQKLRARDRAKYLHLAKTEKIELHPLFIRAPSRQ